MSNLSSSSRAASPYLQDSLFCYGDAIAARSAEQKLVCTMRLAPKERENAGNLSLFDEDASAPAKKSSPRAIHRFYNAADLPSLEPMLGGSPDTYISQATFDRKSRREVNVASIQTLYADLDIYNINMDVPEAVGRIQQLFDSIGMDSPAVSTVSSGRGLYVKIPLDKAVEKKDLYQWKRVEQGLINLLSPLGADAKVRDVSRVLRAVGSVNSKSGNTVDVLHQATRAVSLSEVAAALEQAGMYTGAVARRARAQRTERTKPAPSEQTHQDDLTHDEQSWSCAFAPFSIEKFHPLVLARADQAPTMQRTATVQRKYAEFCWQALSDIDRLARLRGGRFMHGIRDASVFWSLVLLARAGLISPENFWTEAFGLSARVAGRYDPLADGTLSTLFQKMCEQTSHGKNGMYIATKERLLDEFCITSDEEAQMGVLCSKWQRDRRLNQSRRAAAAFDDLRSDARQSIAKLIRIIDKEKICAVNERRAACLSAADLAKKMGVTAKTVQTHLNRLAAHGMI